VFSLDATARVDALPVVLIDGGEQRETLTSSLGEFHLAVPTATTQPAVSVADYAIEVAVPQP